MTRRLVIVTRPLRNTRSVAALLAVLLLAGCTTASRGTSEAFRLLFNRQVTATPEQVAANRFPQAQIKAPDLSAVMVLGYVDDDQQTWYAGSHAVFRMDSAGILTGTSGLGRDYQSRIVGESPFPNLLSVVSPVTLQREYDWSPAYKMGVPVTGTLVRAGTDTVEILGQKRDLVRFEETLRGGGMKERNIYWADAATGFIWQSRQYLAPGYAVELVQLKPYRQGRE